jgi:hypothetical protein
MALHNERASFMANSAIRLLPIAFGFLVLGGGQGGAPGGISRSIS